jgi:hypothetical protein
MGRWMLGVLMLGTVSVALAGPPKYKPVRDSVELKPGQALLVVALDDHSKDSDAIQLLDPQGQPAAVLKVPTGRKGFRYHLFALPAGEYRIGTVRLPDVRGKPFEFDATVSLRLEAGQVNYFGEFQFDHGRGGLYSSLRDRTGRFVTNLRDSHPGVHARYPVVYVGDGNGDWSRSIR